MNGPTESRTGLGIYFLATLGAFLVVGALAWFLYARTRPVTLNQARIEERLKYLHEINTTSVDALNNFGWQDQSKGLVRLSVGAAMDLVVREWKNPAVGRSNLLARVDKANPPPPPPEPPKPTPFE
jgi:hypothetical protein